MEKLCESNFFFRHIGLILDANDCFFWLLLHICFVASRTSSFPASFVFPSRSAFFLSICYLVSIYLLSCYLASSFPLSFVVHSLNRKRLADNVSPRAGEGGKRDKEKQKEKERREKEKDAILREKKVRAWKKRTLVFRRPRTCSRSYAGHHHMLRDTWAYESHSNIA